MKLRLIGKPYAEAEVDLNGFKKDLTCEWDMESAIKENTKIRCREKDDAESLKNLVWGALDWAGIIEELSKGEDKVMKIKFCLVKYEDWKKFYPGTISNGEIEFMEKNEEGYATLLIQSFIKSKNFDLKGFIKQGQYLYAPTKDRIVGWVPR